LGKVEAFRRIIQNNEDLVHIILDIFGWGREDLKQRESSSYEDLVREICLKDGSKVEHKSLSEGNPLSFLMREKYS
jgi:hypothetical protein